MSAYARFLAHGKDLKMLFQVSPVPSRAKFKPLLLFSTARLLNQSSPYRLFSIQIFLKSNFYFLNRVPLVPTRWQVHKEKKEER